MPVEQHQKLFTQLGTLEGTSVASPEKVLGKDGSQPEIVAGASDSWAARPGFQLWTGCPNSMTCCEALSRSNELAKYFKQSSPSLIAVTWSVAPLALQQGTFLEVAMWGMAWGEVSGGGHVGAWLQYQGSLRNMHTKLHDFSIIT